MATTRPPLRPDPERQAQEVAQQLVANLGHSPNLGFLRSSETHYPLLADVEFAMEELNHVVLSASYTNSGVLCVQDGSHFVPIVGLPPSLALFGNWANYPPSYGVPPFPVGRNFEGIMGDLFSARIVPAQTSELPQMVLSPLTKFLAVRFQWVADNPEFRSLGAAPSARANNPYLPFTVHTNTPGLRIHYSTTFAINFNNVFGAPTTPLKGWILPGIHKFAGMDRNGNFHYDPGSFTTPPDFSANLMM